VYMQLSIFTGFRYRGEDPNQWLCDESRPVLLLSLTHILGLIRELKQRPRRRKQERQKSSRLAKQQLWAFRDHAFFSSLHDCDVEGVNRKTTTSFYLFLNFSTVF